MGSENIEDNILVSVCISVHNTETYLRRCLESVFSQTLREIEIILVDNGSTDNSYDIMMEYKNNYPEKRVTIIRQNDLGLAQGRFAGVKNASGQYVAFLDADDYVEHSAYEESVNIALKSNCDIVEFQTHRKGDVLASQYSGLQLAPDVLRVYFSGGKIYSMLWMRIYRRELFENVIFPELYVNNEDMFAFPCLLSHAETIYFMKKSLHYYADDNELGYMNKLKKSSPKKIIESKSKAISSLKFVETNVYDIDAYIKEFYIYKKRRIIDFLTYPIKGYGFKSRMKIIFDVLGISQGEINNLIKNTRSNIPLFDCFEKRFGFRTACFFYKQLYRFRKGVNV